MRISSEYVDNIVVECGGFGRYQIMLLTLILLFGKLSSTWTMLIMSVAGAIPDWSCTNNITEEAQTLTGNQTETFMKCYLGNDTKCTEFLYDNSLRTVVSEWDLVCDRAWITSTITTIQMAGVLVSAVASGHFSDYFGRKPTLFISIFLLAVLNLIAYFSVSWQMFAVVRFLLGCGSAMYLAVYFPLLTEFIPTKERPLVSALPSWTIWAALLGGVAWLIPDWANLHLTTAAFTVPILFTWWLIPESFRWLISKNRIEEAEAVIRKMAKMNRKPVPDLSKLKAMTDSDEKIEHYSAKDLFRTWKLARTSILLSLMWIFNGYTYYAISFGVQKLSGSIFLNIFLISAVELPCNMITYWSANRIGRKWTCVLFLTLSGVAACTVAIVEIIDIEPSMKGVLINAFALISRIGNSAGWCAKATLTTESYPTVIRATGYDFLSTTARIGAMAAPQVVYLVTSHKCIRVCQTFVKIESFKHDKRSLQWVHPASCYLKSTLVPGLLYFLCGATSILSAVCAGVLEETRHKPLQDVMECKIKVKPKNMELREKL